MVALYDYTAQGPEDLEFSEGDTIDILSEGTHTCTHTHKRKRCLRVDWEAEVA